MLMELLGVLCAVAGLVCWIIILVDAFRDAVWKGIVFILCGLYALYYAVFEFEADNKWLIVLGALAGGGIGGVLISAGARASGAH